MKDLVNADNQNSSPNSSLTLNVIIVILGLLILFLGYTFYSQISIIFSDNLADHEINIPTNQIQIEILNGCGVAGIADSFTEILRNKGFDVVNKGNYSSFNIDETLLVDRSGDKNKTNILATSLGINDNNIVEQLNEQYFLDISLIVGKDYKKYFNN